MSSPWRLVLALALALLAVSCRAEANLTLNIAEDGSGMSTVELGIDEELQGLIATITDDNGGPPFLDLGGLLGVESDQSTLLDAAPLRVEGDMTFWGTSRSFATTEELEELVTAAAEQFTFDTFEVSLQNKEISISAAISAPGDSIDDIDLPISLELFENALSAHIIISLPGHISEHNANIVLPDGRLKWEISLTEGVDIRAVANFGESGFPWWIAIMAMLLLAVLVAIILIARRKSKTPSAALASVPTPPKPTGFKSHRLDDKSLE